MQCVEGLTFDGQMQKFTGAILCHMVCDGQRLGLWLTFWVIPSSTKTAGVMHDPTCLECYMLLFPFSAVLALVLLCASDEHPPWIQHEHGILCKRGIRWSNLTNPKLEIQRCSHQLGLCQWLSNHSKIDQWWSSKWHYYHREFGKFWFWLWYFILNWNCGVGWINRNAAFAWPSTKTEKKLGNYPVPICST